MTLDRMILSDVFSILEANYMAAKEGEEMRNVLEAFLGGEVASSTNWLHDS